MSQSKLVAVIGLEEYDEQLNKLFARIEIPVFSELDIRGFRVPEDEQESIGNWFAHRRNPIYSSLNFAFLTNDQADRLMNAIMEFNETTAKQRPVHAFMMNVERAI